jgi:hypothetical protein
MKRGVVFRLLADWLSLAGWGVWSGYFAEDFLWVSLPGGVENALHSSRRHDPADLSEPVRRVIEALSRRRVNRWVVAEWTLHAVFAVQNRWLGRRHDPLMHPDLAERRRRNRHESIMLVKYVSGAAVWRVKDMGGLRGAARIKHRLALLTFL